VDRSRRRQIERPAGAGWDHHEVRSGGAQRAREVVTDLERKRCERDRDRHAECDREQGEHQARAACPKRGPQQASEHLNLLRRALYRTRRPLCPK